jgi:hypothetical protein
VEQMGEKRSNMLFILTNQNNLGLTCFYQQNSDIYPVKGGIEPARLGMQSKQMDKHAEGGEAAKILKDHPWLDEKDWTYSDS